jgi:hypothetical protein
MRQGSGVGLLRILQVLWCSGIALSIAFGSPPAHAQDEPDRCAAPLAPAGQAIDPQAFWNDDRAISVWRRQDGDRYAYRIVGDIVELTPSLFSALATVPGQPLRDISEISIDAREIVVAMPLRVANGSIKLYAEAVRFTGDGSLSLTQPPTGRDQMVEIVARTLDLSRAPDMPFMFPTQGWVLGAKPRWPAPDAARRLLRIKVQTVMPPADASDPARRQLAEDPLRWFHNKTADQGFDSGLPKQVWSAGYDIAIGEAAGTIYDGLLGTTLLWPDVAVAKLARLWTRAPLDPAVDAFVRAKIDELLPLLSRRAGRASVGTLTLMREQMALGLDPFGNRPDEVPMTGLPDRLKTFQKLLDEVFGTGKKPGTLALWDEARLIALDTDQLADPGKQVAQIDRALRAQASERAVAARRIAAGTDRLLAMIQDGNARIAEAASIDGQLLAQYTEEKTQALSFGRIVDELAVNETTLGIGRPAAAPNALGWAPGATVPAAYYGTRGSAGPDGAPRDLGEIAVRYQAYAALIADFNVAWKTVDPHLAAALGDLTGKQKNETELAAFDAAMDEVARKAAALRNGLSSGPAEFTLGLNDYAPVDPEQYKKMLTLLQEAEAATATAGNVQAAILADTQQVRAIDADLQWLGAMRADLLALKSLPKADAVQRQALLDGFMRARLLVQVAQSATMLRKGFSYVTGQGAPIADEVLHPFDDALVAYGIDTRHPELYDPAQMQLALGAKRAALGQYYESFAGALAEQAGAFVDKQPADPPGVEFFRAAYDDDVSHDLEATFLRTRFLDSLNRSIAAQIDLGRSGAGFASHPILVPIAISPPGPSGGPRFLLGVAVTKVHFQGDSKMQSRIDLRIEHPRWGEVTIDGICHRMIDAADDPDGIETGFSTTIPLTRDVTPDWREAVAPDQAFAKILANAFPLEAPYYAYVDVSQPGAWTSAPVIDEIEIQFVKTGTRLP